MKEGLDVLVFERIKCGGTTPWIKLSKEWKSVTNLFIGWKYYRISKKLDYQELDIILIEQK